MGLSHRRSATLILVVLFAWHAPGVVSQNQSQPAVNQRNSRQKTKVDVKYDKAKELTTVRLAYMKLWENPFEFEQVDLTLSFTYPKHIIVTPKSILLIIKAAGRRRPLFEHQRDLRVMTDVSIFSLGEMKRGATETSVPNVGSQPFFEVLSLPIPYEDFSRIATAKEVKLQIGARVYSLTDKQVQSLGNFLELLQQEGLEFR